MYEVIEMMFIEMSRALGYEAWYETESAWDSMAEVMYEVGLDESEVDAFFNERGWEI